MYSRGERVHIYLSVRRELNKILYKKYCKKERYTCNKTAHTKERKNTRYNSPTKLTVIICEPSSGKFFHDATILNLKINKLRLLVLLVYR